ncbi:MAG: TetR/AcrR family transcriptional regulator C-terminal domain-containing protein [Eubacterium sp.]|nr:TetR/AcrR family transcriptional regulator C-terminal domain-containing protein [Eubacterium sp.]
MADYTKWRFADTLLNLMEQRSFKKITVKDICVGAGEKRQTFYYHFRDKYDLVTWIYYQDAQKTIDQYPGESWDYVLEKIFEKMDQRRAFYKNAFSETGQNALIDYMVEHDILIYKDKLKKLLIDPDTEKEIIFAIEYHAYACAHLTKQWLTKETGLSAEKMAARMYQNMPNVLKAQA